MDLLNPFVNGTVHGLPPSAWEFLHFMAPFDVLFLAFGTLFAVLIVALGMLHLYCVFNYITSEIVQSDLYWIVFLCPCSALCSIIGMFIPRASLFLYSVALVYFMVCLFILVSLTRNIYGSRSAMSRYLFENSHKISLQVPPFCCCCPFLPKLEPTRYSLRRIEWMVMQTPLIRIFLEIANIATISEIQSRASIWFTASNIIAIVSMFIAFYGCHILISLGPEKLEPYRLVIMFRCMDLIQAIYAIQKFAFDLMAIFHVFNSDAHMSASAKAQYMNSFFLLCEVLIVSLIATYLLHPRKNAIFDKYQRANRKIIEVASSSPFTSIIDIQA